MIELGQSCEVGALHVRDFIQFGDAFRLQMTRGQHGANKRLRLQALAGNSAELELMPANDIDTSKGGILSQILLWTDADPALDEHARLGINLRRQSGGTKAGELDVCTIDLSTYNRRPCPPIEIMMGESTAYVDGKETVFSPPYYAIFIQPDGSVQGLKRNGDRVTLSEGSTLTPAAP